MTDQDQTPPPDEISPQPEAYRVIEGNSNGRNAKYVNTRTSEVADVSEADYIPEDDSDVENSLTLAGSRIFKGRAWGLLFAFGFIGLLLFEVGTKSFLFFSYLIAENSLLGAIGFGLMLLAALGLTGLIIREWLALKSLRKIDHLRQSFEEAVNLEEQAEAKKAIAQLLTLYADRPKLEEGRKAVRNNLKEIIESSELIEHAENNLLVPLDREVQTLIMQSAKRIALFTTVNTRISLETLIVLAENLRMIRRIMAVYGGRPSISSSYRLARNVFSNLLAAAGLEAGSEILTEAVGQGVLSKISSSIGQGLVNGMLTIRVGFVAQKICRPCPFSDASKPSVTQLFGALSKSVDAKEEKSSSNGGTQ